jgi:hypothetical protein
VFNSSHCSSERSACAPCAAAATLCSWQATYVTYAPCNCCEYAFQTSPPVLPIIQACNTLAGLKVERKPIFNKAHVFSHHPSHTHASLAVCEDPVPNAGTAFACSVVKIRPQACGAVAKVLQSHSPPIAQPRMLHQSSRRLACSSTQQTARHTLVRCCHTSCLCVLDACLCRVVVLLLQLLSLTTATTNHLKHAL